MTGMGVVQGQELVADPLLAAMVRLYGEPVISANPYLLNSTSNPYGPWGAKEFLYSFNNDVGPLGSPEFLNSVSNEYGTGLRIGFSEKVLEEVPELKTAVELYGEPVVSANPDLLNSTSNDYGPYGAPESLVSPTNDYGPFGAPEFLDSVNNEYGRGLKVELLKPMLDLNAP
jgi:hypothetical protein